MDIPHSWGSEVSGWIAHLILGQSHGNLNHMGSSQQATCQSAHDCIPNSNHAHSHSHSSSHVWDLCSKQEDHRWQTHREFHKTSPTPEVLVKHLHCKEVQVKRQKDICMPATLTPLHNRRKAILSEEVKIIIIYNVKIIQKGMREKKLRKLKLWWYDVMIQKH